MASEIHWEVIGLTEDPFAMSPPTDPKAAVWADATELRKEFEQTLQEAKGSVLTQVILCRGPVGGGKTHAAVYYSLPDRWPRQNPSIESVQVIRIPTPKEVGKPSQDFYLDVMESIRIEKTSAMVRREVENLGHQQVFDTLRQIMVSADLANALIQLGGDENSALTRAYFLGRCTPSELRKLGLNRNIEKTQDYFRVLAGVISCHVGLSPSRGIADHSRICLWLDEMEDFVYFSPAQYRPFTQGLRELIDRVPSFLTMFLNFTHTSSEEYEEIELILGNYLIDRVTREIIFDEMRDEKEEMEYVRDLLGFYRIEDGKTANSAARDPYFPFEQDALEMLLYEMPRRTPRNVNKRCRNALMKAFADNRFRKGDVRLIDREFVQRITREDLDREF